MSLLGRTMPAGRGVKFAVLVTVFMIIVNSALAYYSSPFYNRYNNRITGPDNRYDRVKIDGQAVEHWRHTEGDLAVMKCITDLNDYPVIAWTKGGRPVPRGMRVYELINKGNSFLEIPRISLRDEGVYTCSVSSLLGYAKKSYRICVIKPGVKEDCPKWWYNWNI